MLILFALRENDIFWVILSILDYYNVNIPGNITVSQLNYLYPIPNLGRKKQS